MAKSRFSEKAHATAQQWRLCYRSRSILSQKLEKLGIKWYKIRQIAEHSTEITGKILLPVTPKFNEDFDEHKTTSIVFLAIDKDLAEKILVLGYLPVD